MAEKLKFIIANDTEVCLLECSTAFADLSLREKLYTHYLSRAAWYGSLVCLLQLSPESPGIFVLLQRLCRKQTIEDFQAVAKEAGLSEEELQALLIYAAAFYANLGNYKSFGDTKFVPNLSKSKVEKVIQNSSAYKAEPAAMQALWDEVGERMYSLQPHEQELGLGDKGTTTYFSSNCDKKDADLAQLFLTAKNISEYNTRLFKYQEAGQTVYEVRLASVLCSGEGEGDMGILGVHKFTPEGATDAVTFKVTRGDYAPLMKLLVENIAKAKEHAANDNEVQMLTEYVRSFTEGSIPAHKDASRHWIKNKGPVIETYIGFIESYRDPTGVRGEFEGFVAMVNKKMSAKFTELVSRAEHFLPLLPWPAAYEKDKFLRPDFTSLDVLSFASSGVPAGINIPNYDDIRQGEGFKNVSLGNVLTSAYKDATAKITFLEEHDKELYSKLKVASFEVQVGLHELLGHGSGKLFSKDSEGKLNFDTENVTHTETEEKIGSWYATGQTYNSQFGPVASSYEECRAECVGIYLCLSSEILAIFGHTHSDADDIIYINWLNMVRAGLLALEFYNPATNKWGQAHMQARFVILRVLLEAGDGLVTVEKIVGEDGEPDLVVHLNRSLINTVGKQAIGDFLRKLQVYKATADSKSGTELYDKYSAVTDCEEPHMLTIRPIVLKRKQPRKLFVQCNTNLTAEGNVELVEYESTAAGVIQSFIERFPERKTEDTLLKLWRKDRPFFS